MICQGSNGIEVDPVGVQVGVNNSLMLWCSAGRATVVAVIAPKISASLATHGDRYSCVVRWRGLCFVEEAFEHLDLGTGSGQVGNSWRQEALVVIIESTVVEARGKLRRSSRGEESGS